MKKETPAAVTTTVQTKEEAAHSQMLVNFGSSIIRKIGEAVQTYLELVTYIRHNKVAPKLVTFELRKIGFKKSKVSEINRVAHASDAVFNLYSAKIMGFDKVLELARHESKNGPIESTEAARLLLEQGTLSKSDVQKAMDEEEEATGTRPKKSAVVKMENAALQILNLAKKAKAWENDKWTLTLAKK